MRPPEYVADEKHQLAFSHSERVLENRMGSQRRAQTSNYAVSVPFLYLSFTEHNLS